MYEPTAIAREIESVRTSNGESVRSAARKADISESRWRQIAKGYQKVTRDVSAPVNAPVETLVKMAAALEMTVDSFRAVKPDGATSPDLIREFQDKLAEVRPTPRGRYPIFGLNTEDPDYILSVEEWIEELESRLKRLEERVAHLEPDEDGLREKQASDLNMSAEDGSSYGLAAKEEDEHIAGDEMPHQP